MKRLGLFSFDIGRGVVLGFLLCYAASRLMSIDSTEAVFRYAGY